MSRESEPTGSVKEVHLRVVEEFWPLFEAGQVANFCAAVAAAALIVLAIAAGLFPVRLQRGDLGTGAYLAGGLDTHRFQHSFTRLAKLQQLCSEGVLDDTLRRAASSV